MILATYMTSITKHWCYWTNMELANNVLNQTRTHNIWQTTDRPGIVGRKPWHRLETLPVHKLPASLSSQIERSVFNRRRCRLKSMVELLKQWMASALAPSFTTAHAYQKHLQPNLGRLAQSNQPSHQPWQPWHRFSTRQFQLMTWTVQDYLLCYRFQCPIGIDWYYWFGLIMFKPFVLS